MINFVILNIKRSYVDILIIKDVRGNQNAILLMV